MIFYLYHMDYSYLYKKFWQISPKNQKSLKSKKEELLSKNVTHLYQQTIMYLSAFSDELGMKKLRKACSMQFWMSK